MPTYQPLIPTGSVPLNIDYQNIQGNFLVLNTVYGTDHVAYDQSVNPGYHNAIHLVPVSTKASNPPNNQPINGYTATPGFGQVFSAEINDGFSSGDTALYFLTGGNRLLQLTRNFTPVAASNGYTMLTGGFVLQWGVVNGSNAGKFNSGDTGTVTFSSSNLAFPNNCFMIWTQPLFTNASTPTSTHPATVGVNQNFSRLSFNWKFFTQSSSYTQFFWIALGN